MTAGTGRLVSITRFPVKGLTGERLDAVEIAAGRGIPRDRTLALALADTVFDEAQPVPLPKTMFAVLARHAELARLRCRFSEDAGRIVIEADGRHLAEGALDVPADRASLAAAITEFMGDGLSGPLRMVSGNDHRFTDVSVRSAEYMEAISVINLASVRDLESRLGTPVDYRRFRGNLLLDGLPAWAELDWVDRAVAIGGLRFRGLKRTRRCPATEVDPDTARRDIRVPLELKRFYDHVDMGVYLSALETGRLQPGDAVTGPT